MHHVDRPCLRLDYSGPSAPNLHLSSHHRMIHQHQDSYLPIIITAWSIAPNLELVLHHVPSNATSHPTPKHHKLRLYNIKRYTKFTQRYQSLIIEMNTPASIIF